MIITHRGVRNMIKAILIDDERLALFQLEKMLKEFTNLDVLASYMDPAKAIKAAPQWKPDVIFLDIDMPEMNGMQAAEVFQGIYPGVEIVFVTAYNEYALEAFELNALDYILKPAQRNRLVKTISRLEERLGDQVEKPLPSRTAILHTCPALRIERDGQWLQLRWRTAKAQELFAYLLHNRNLFVSKDTLIELFWPDYEQKKAATHLYTTIYQVRQCLKQTELDIQLTNASGGNEGYTLNLHNVLLDIEIWEKTVQALEPINEHNVDDHYKCIEQNRGDYLGNFDYMWAEGERQRLRTIWLLHAMEVADFYKAHNRLSSAVTIYQRIVQLQPYSEDGHFRLMQVYEQLGDRNAVEEQFRIATQLFQDELGIGLSDDLRNWYTNYKS